MAVQLLELIFFAGIALLIISKLISILGVTNDDQQNKRSFYGEPGNLRDVTEKSSGEEFLSKFLSKTKDENFDNLIVVENYDNVMLNYKELQAKMLSFSLDKFVRGSKGAFDILINNNDKSSTIDELIDKRFVESFNNKIPNYNKLKSNLENITAKISDIYSFGNNAFIKVRFAQNSNGSENQNFVEEWTFMKNVYAASKNWQVSNIETYN